MVYSSASDKAGIVEEIDFLCSSNNVTYPIEQKTRNVNRAMDKVVSTIINSDGRWQWDDDNQTDLPIATTNIVSGQQDYSFTINHLKIEKVMVQDNASGWQALPPIDLTDRDINTYLIGTPQNGTPLRYDFKASSLFLYPTPNYSATGGIRIYFQRPSTYFTTTDTTKSPGFASIFHRYLSFCAAFDFQTAKGLVTVLRNGMTASALNNEITKMEQSIIQWYSNRNKTDGKNSLRPRRRNYE